MTYTRDVVEFLAPAIWDDECMLGMEMPFAPDMQMRSFRGKADPATGNSLLALIVDVRMAWDNAGLTHRQRQAVLLCHGVGMNDTLASIAMRVNRTTVIQHRTAGIGHMTAWLNGKTYDDEGEEVL